MAGQEIGELMHVHNAAKKLACSKRFIYRLIEDGKLTGVRLGARGVRITKESVLIYMRENRIDPGEKFC